jgi:DNA-binding NarL/FixJ family response regulator
VKPKVLIVDDNSVLRETTRRILKLKFPTLRIFEACNGKEAYAQIHDNLPNLALMDIQLPGENGLKLTSAIKKLYPEVVIIIFTNHDLPEYREAAYENGADFFVSKSSPNRKKLSTLVGSILADAGLDLYSSESR